MSEFHSNLSASNWKTCFQRSRFSVQGLCRVAVMTALYVPLARLAIEMGTLKISFGSLPVTVLALLAGPAEAALAAFLGEFLKQMLDYGFTATTLLWMIPPALRGLLIGLAAVRLWRTGKPLEKRPVACYAVGVLAAVVTTLANTLVIWLDSVLYGYYTPAYVFGNLLLRLGVGVTTAVLVSIAAMSVVPALSRQGLVRREARS